MYNNAKQKKLDVAVKNIEQKRKHLTDVDIGRIIEAADQGESHRSIGKRFKRENSTISRLVKKYKHTGKTEKAVGSGRKPKTSKKDDRYILNAVKKKRKITCSEIKLDLNHTNIQSGQYLASLNHQVIF
nr:uncharacterized protein LOC124817353 [Hydra vulgaris]